MRREVYGIFRIFIEKKQRSASGALMPLALLQNEHQYDAEGKRKKKKKKRQKQTEKEKRIITINTKSDQIRWTQKNLIKTSGSRG